ncbi:AAA family ATPase [Desulfobacca acetoxidans]
MPFRGILLLGVPRTGKSYFTKALGNEVGWPVLSLDMGRVFGSLVGESEAKMREALKVVDAMAPCLLFIDEIEKVLAGVGGGASNPIESWGHICRLSING